MTAAVYARKSTEQTGVAEEQRSVARQVEHAQAYAVRKGWTVAAEHVFVDDGISGAEFANRPGFLRLMNGLKPRPSFQVLVMSEESRLGREAIETAYALKQIIQAGVRVFFYLEDRERTLDSPTDKIMLSLTAFADELEREKARQRTADAMHRLAERGAVTGGRVFGYDNLPVLGADGRRSHVERRVNESEAVVVRRIFELAAAGWGKKRIAVSLNEEGAPAPRAQQGRPRAWSPSSVFEVLNRPLYRGEIVWNSSRKRDRWGRKNQQPRPESEWLRLPAPHLRIIDERLWQATQARLAESREAYLRGTRGQLWGRPVGHVEPKYLLSGFATCAKCGGSLYVRSRSHGSRRAFFYGCSSYHLRGGVVCENCMELPLEVADRAVVGRLNDDLLQPSVVRDAVRRAMERLAPRHADQERDRRAVAVEVEQMDREVARLATAIAQGGEMAGLLVALQDRERRRSELTDRLSYLDAVARVPRVDGRRLERELVQALARWKDLLAQEPQLARPVLRRLLLERLKFKPLGEGLHVPCEFSGRVSLGGMLSGVISEVQIAWRPQAESTLLAPIEIRGIVRVA